MNCHSYGDNDGSDGNDRDYNMAGNKNHNYNACHNMAAHNNYVDCVPIPVEVPAGISGFLHGVLIFAHTNHMLYMVDEPWWNAID